MSGAAADPFQQTSSPGAGMGVNRTTYTARRFDDLPPPPQETYDLPLPSYQRIERIEGEFPKRVQFDYTFIGRAGVDDPSTNVKMSQIRTSYQHRWPLNESTIFTFRPLVDVLFLSGPGGPVLDLPEQLYIVAVDVMAEYQFNERIGFTAAVTPGFFTDFLRVTSKDIRVPIRLLANYRVWDGLTIAGGILWTDNFYRNLLPAAGVVWDVNEHIRLEGFYPHRARAIYIFNNQWQVYGLIERGGTTYNIRSFSMDQDFQYRDIRLMLGAQIDVWDRVSLFTEFGGAVGRKFRLEFQPNPEIRNAFIFRAGAKF